MKGSEGFQNRPKAVISKELDQEILPEELRAFEGVVTPKPLTTCDCSFEWAGLK